MNYFNERIVEVPWLGRNLKLGNSLDIGSCESSYIPLLEKYGEITRVDFRKIEDTKNFVILSDIRKLKPEQIGKFDNVILLSTLEHMGPKGYFNVKFEKNPLGEQRFIFRHCLKFVKDGGSLLFSTMISKKNFDGGWFFVYTYREIEYLKAISNFQNFQVLNEELYTLKETYESCKLEDIPEEPFDNFQNIVRAKSVICINFQKKEFK